MKRKILIIIYNIERAREHEWFIEFIDANLFELEFVLINKPQSFLRNFLLEAGVKVHCLSYRGKSDMFSLIWKLFWLMRKNCYQFVHAHLFEATFSGMIAAYLARVPVRIITRHNSDFHHVYFPNAVKYDKLANILSTDIIAVSDNVKSILVEKEGVHPDKVNLIHHGIDLAEFGIATQDELRLSEMKLKYELDNTNPIIGVVSRFIFWKGVQFIIPAFKGVLAKYPDAVLVLANAQGPYKKEILSLLDELNPKNYRLIEFENDVACLYRTFDCFVHTPVSSTAEAFGQTYIEAMASRIPCVISISGIASEFAVDNENCLVVPHNDSNSISIAVLKVLSNKYQWNNMLNNAYQIVHDRFDVHLKYKKLNELYKSKI